MIEFYGTLSEKIHIQLLKRIDAYMLRNITLVVVPLFIGCALFMLLHEHDKEMFYLLIGGAVLPVALWSFFCIKPASKKRMKKFNWLQTIVLNKEENRAYRYSASQQVRQLSDVRKVIDCGDFYYLRFDILGDRSNLWVCQKDLLVRGSLEEFEEMFAGKIVRKKIKKSPITY